MFTVRLAILDSCPGPNAPLDEMMLMILFESDSS